MVRDSGSAAAWGTTASAGHRLLNKVPEITIFFWLIKMMCTTVGETGADHLIFNVGLGLPTTAAVMGALLVVALAVQFRTPRYVPVAYWSTVVLISIVGTLITDYLTDEVGVPLETSTLVFAVALIGVFAVWWARERTLSIHTIYTVPREAFYWLAVLVTFALGTAAGDLVAERMDLGYGRSILLFGALIAAVALAWYGRLLDPVPAFWLAYVLTRPFGASVGDYLSQTRRAGGLGLGTTHTSEIFLVGILVLVAYLSITRRDATREPAVATAFDR